ncbi:hypothetical protein [Prochlorococcus marinus]|nr:hypothetical protein [Prochlorococcus marinus]
MSKTILVISIIILLFIQLAKPALATPSQKFREYMEIWTENSELASKYLKEAENEFKQGDELEGCVNQRKAAIYGIKGTESLIKAFEISGSTNDLSNIESGLAKWKELRDFC